VHSQENPTFHIVCHDCPFEALVTDSAEAEKQVSLHVAETGHSARYARVD
jgi:hypothetical protein